MTTPQPGENGELAMRCPAHDADSCTECGPAPPAAWTVGRLRAAIAGLPDDTPLVINAEDFTDPDITVEQVIVGAGFGKVDWGDGYGLEPGTVFGLDCAIPDGPIELRSGQSIRALTLHEPSPGERSGSRQPSPGGAPRADQELEIEP